MSDETTRNDQDSIPTELPATRDLDPSRSGGAIDDTQEKQIGPYRLLEPLGEGGMGQVWLAEQTEPVKRKVALKVIKPGMDSKQVVARFEAERQALALMDHPAIAKVYDAGTTPRGRPYFVMEYVQGVPITAYCDERTLSNRDRLQLFMRVCEGVQHAHQKAVIHRDLKPSNVLVAEQDGKPAPKIIDFGVAKAIKENLTDKTIQTQLGGMIGTPAYMSPEQAVIGEQDIDTRTDVYALGVMLYELLVGTLPFEMKELQQAGFEAMIKKIREEDPPRPSSRVSTLSGRSEEAAVRRGTMLPTLRRELSGDLDWIAMRALEKERERRYASPSEFAADVARFLSNEPVVARPPSPAYLAKKFVRRHRWGVSAAAVGVLLLIAFAATMSVQANRIARERDIAEQMVTFQEDMLGEIDLPTMGLSLLDYVAGRVGGDPAAFRAITAGVNTTDLAVSVLDRTILSRALETLDDRFADRPLIDSRLRGTIGSLYLDLGRWDRAEPLLSAVLEANERDLGRDHPVTLDSIHELARLYMQQTRYDEAEALLLEALEGRERKLGPHHRATIDTLETLAILYNAQGQLDEAEVVARDILDRVRSTRDEDHIDSIEGRELLASIFTNQGRYAETEAILSETVATKTRLYGRDDERTLGSMDNLALALSSVGRLDEATELAAETLTLYRERVGNDHPYTLDAMNHLGNLYRMQGRFDEADALYVEALDGRRRVTGADHLGTISVRFNIATSYMVQGRFDEAEPILLDVFDARTRILGEDHADTLDAVSNIAALYLNHNRFDEAEPWARKAVDRRRRVLGAEHPSTLDAVNNLAILEWRLQRYDAAERLMREKLAIVRKSHGDSSSHEVSTLSVLQTILLAKGERAGAVDVSVELVGALERDSGAEPQVKAIALYNLACLYALEGRRDAALEAFSKAVDAGFADVELMKTDTDLDSIRGVEFDAILDKVDPSG
jgi:non-specific serine/threonine protein kinase/serine/threonine-protein kinase